MIFYYNFPFSYTIVHYWADLTEFLAWILSYRLKINCLNYFHCPNLIIRIFSYRIFLNLFIWRGKCWNDLDSGFCSIGVCRWIFV